MRCCRCNQPADAWMTFEYDESHIDIYSMPDGWRGYGGYAMCTAHANRLRAPRGWTLHDSRDDAPTPFPMTQLTIEWEVAAATRASDVA